MKKDLTARFSWITAALICLSIHFTWGEPPSDPVSSRVLQFTREHGHYVDAPGYPKDHTYWEDLQWYRAQGAAVRPALMYLLTDEYRGDYGKMSDIVTALRSAPGDQTELLEFLRSELAQQPEPRPDNYYMLVNSALPVFSAYGNRGDLDLIRQYEADDDVRVRVNVGRHIENLEERLSNEGSNPVREPRASDRQENDAEAGSKVPSGGVPAFKLDDAEGGGLNWALWSAGCVLVVAIAVFFVSRRHKP